MFAPSTTANAVVDEAAFLFLLAVTDRFQARL